MATEALVQALQLQARICGAMGSPFSAGLLQQAAADVEAGEGSILALLAPWADASREALFADAAPLRWLGAAHDLALCGEDPAVSGAWPTADLPGDATAAFGALRTAMTQRPQRFGAFMSHEPQTNEVRRSVCLLGGFLEVAQATGLPLRTLELGASAGLNQLWDRYRYDLGDGAAWGDEASPVRLDTEWRGPPPPLAASARVIARAACDRAPIDLREPAARQRLRAYLWAGQFDRLARLDAAIGVALAHDVRVEPLDALAFVGSRLAPQAGVATVVYHSVFWQYLPHATQAGLEAAIAEAGAGATPSAPLAWLRMEPRPPSVADMEVRLTLWPGGEDRRLARCHPHGAWVEWESAAVG